MPSSYKRSLHKTRVRCSSKILTTSETMPIAFDFFSWWKPCGTRYRSVSIHVSSLDAWTYCLRLSGLFFGAGIWIELVRSTSGLLRILYKHALGIFPGNLRVRIARTVYGLLLLRLVTAKSMEHCAGCGWGCVRRWTKLSLWNARCVSRAQH